MILQRLRAFQLASYGPANQALIHLGFVWHLSLGWVWNQSTHQIIPNSNLWFIVSTTASSFYLLFTYLYSPTLFTIIPNPTQHFFSMISNTTSKHFFFRIISTPIQTQMPNGPYILPFIISRWIGAYRMVARDRITCMILFPCWWRSICALTMAM